jgi:serine/threonine protein kinase
VLKLFDFGLSTCVRRRSFETEAYVLTGNTGSLRYMAPEVASQLPYSEKVDVYSFGIIVWQMAKDRIPFHGMSRQEFKKFVVDEGRRLKLDPKWSVRFMHLLEKCWHRSPVERPSFGDVSALIDELVLDTSTDAATWPAWCGCSD